MLTFSTLFFSMLCSRFLSYLYTNAHFLYVHYVISFGLCRATGVCTTTSHQKIALCLYPADLNHRILYHTVSKSIKILFLAKSV